MSTCKICQKSSTKNPSTSFFRFPKDLQRCESWIKKCNLTRDLEKYGSSSFYKMFRICDTHFQRAMIRFDGKKNKLLNNAEPELFLSPQVVELTEEFTSNKLHCNRNCEFKCRIEERLCRLCGLQCEILTDIFGPFGVKINLPAKLKHINIQISKNDSLSTKICNSCTRKLISCHDFIETCQRTQSKFKTTKCTKNIKIVASTKIRTDGIPNSSSKVCEPIKGPTAGRRTVNFSTYKFVDFSSSISLQHDYSNLWIKNSSIENENEWLQGNIYRCYSCHKGFSTLDCLKAHEKAHLLSPGEDGLFTCEECGSSFKNRFRCCAHLRQHSGEKPYKCIICNNRFHRLFLLKQHKLIHARKKFSCDTCQRTFHRKVSLIKHFDGLCRESFVASDSQLEHNFRKSIKGLQRTGSQKGLVYNSLHLKNGSTSSSGLCSSKNKVLSKGEDAKYLCSICGKRFARSDTFKNHFRTHTGERPFACHICDFKFKQKGDCRKHEKNHHTLV